MSSGTNPAYAHLAYQRAVIEHVANKVLENNIGDNDHPQELIECPYVAGGAPVPREEVIHFVENLRVQGSRVEDEMNKFEFVRRNDGTAYDPGYLGSVLQPRRADQGQESKAPQGGEVGKAQKRRRRKRRKNRRAT